VSASHELSFTQKPWKWRLMLYGRSCRSRRFQGSQPAPLPTADAHEAQTSGCYGLAFFSTLMGTGTVLAVVPNLPSLASMTYNSMPFSAAYTATAN